MNFTLQSSKKRIFSYCLLFLMLLCSVSFSRSVRAIVCFILSLAYLSLIDKSNFFKFGEFVKSLYGRKKLVFSSKFVNQLSLKKIIFPSFLEASGIFCFGMLFVSKLLKTLRLEHIFGLFIPILLLSFGNILDLFMNSKNKRIIAWRQWFIKKVYRKNPFLVKTYILASYVLAIGLVFAYSLFAFKSSLYSIEWYSYGFFDKRTVYLTYLLFMVGFLFVPYFYSAFVHCNSLPTAIKTSKISNNYWKRCICLGIAFLIATYFWGPPFNIGLYTEAPDTHEVVHLAPLLGIEQGRVPFTEAQIQYGPGSQLAQYFYLKNFGFDLFHLRESFFFFHYIFVLIFFSALWFYVGPVQASIATIFCLIFCSSFNFFTFNSNGEPTGYFGWFNGFRYLGPPILALAMAHLFPQKVPSKIHLICIGILYGLLLYMAQENFSCGIVTLILGSTTACAARYVSFKELASMARFFLFGITLIIIPILGFYAYHNQLGEFIHQYFGVSSAVVQGFSNTPWSSGFGDPSFLPYILTPVTLFLVVFFILYVQQKRPIYKDKDLLRLVFLAIAAISLHQISLFRADSSHYIAPSITLPILFGLIFYDILKNSLLLKKERIGYASMFLLFLITIYPSIASFKTFPALLTAPAYRYSIASFVPLKPNQVFLKPFGFYRDPSSKSASYNKANTAEFISEMKAIKEIVGKRSTIVANLEGNHTSSVYFFANLKIGTKMIETLHSVINSKDREKFIEEIRSNPIQCLITNHLHEKEAVAFLKRFPNAVIHRRVYDDIPYHILCDGKK